MEYLLPGLGKRCNLDLRGLKVMFCLQGQQRLKSCWYLVDSWAFLCDLLLFFTLSPHTGFLLDVIASLDELLVKCRSLFRE